MTLRLSGGFLKTRKALHFWSAIFFIKKLKDIAKAGAQDINKLVAPNWYTAQCSITVLTSITSLSVGSTSKTLNVGETVQLTRTVNASSTTEEVPWTF